MRSEKLRKRMAKKKETEPAPSGFGGFLSGAISGLLAANARQPSTPEIDWEIAKRTAKRIVQERERSQRVERLNERLERLERQEAARKRAASTGRKSLLWGYVAKVKRKNPSKKSNHRFIAMGVDLLLERDKMKLGDVCPKPWRKVPDLPSLLRDAQMYPPLKGRVKTFIAKVPIS